MRYAFGAWMFLMVALVVFTVYGLVQLSAGRQFCFERGDEFATAYVGGTVACIETTNGTRRVVTHKRK